MSLSQEMSRRSGAGTAFHTPAYRLQPPAAVSGFTFLELMVTVVILGIISAAVVPLFRNSMSDVQARSSEADLVALIAFLQEASVAEGREYRLYLDDEDQKYWVEFLTIDDDGDEVFVPVAAAYGEETHLPDHVSFDSIRAREDRGVDGAFIACYPNGSCDPAEISLFDRRQRRNLDIEVTGVMGEILVDGE